TGTENADNVVVTDPMPAGANLSNVFAGGSFDPDADVVTWNLGTLQVGSPATLTFSVSVPPDPATGQVAAQLTLRNVASFAFSNDSGGNSGSGQSQQVVVSSVSHTLVKTATPSLSTPVEPGQAITYSLTYTNTGSAPLQQVRLSDALPLGT